MKNNKIKLTYKVFTTDASITQKTVSATVSNNSDAFNQLRETVSNRFPNCILMFNHTGKTVEIINQFQAV